MFFQTLNYEVPKSLRGWVNEGDKMIRENRIQRMNNSYEALDKSIYSGQSLGVENDPIFKNAIGVKREADPYDQYLSVFTSEKALRLSPAKRRHALANAMAAAALKDAKKPYDKERIQERGKALMKKDVFKNMSDLDVARALFNPKAVNQARQNPQEPLQQEQEFQMQI